MESDVLVEEPIGELAADVTIPESDEPIARFQTVDEIALVMNPNGQVWDRVTNDEDTHKTGDKRVAWTLDALTASQKESVHNFGGSSKNIFLGTKHRMIVVLVVSTRDLRLGCSLSST